MDKGSILEALKDDDKYYGEFGKQFLSNSDIGKLLKNPTQFRVSQTMTKPMLEGRYFHTKILEPQKLSEFKVIDVASRNTKAYKESIDEGEILLLKKEKEHLDFLCTKMTSNMEMFDYIYEDGNEFEVPEIQKIMSLDWKAKTYNYDSQAYIYQRLFGKPLIFLVIDKLTARLGIFECSDAFLRGGADKVERAVEVYQKYFSDEATEDIHSYIHRQTL
jgi:hypothetical protein